MLNVWKMTSSYDLIVQFSAPRSTAQLGVAIMQDTTAANMVTVGPNLAADTLGFNLFSGAPSTPGHTWRWDPSFLPLAPVDGSQTGTILAPGVTQVIYISPTLTHVQFTAPTTLASVAGSTLLDSDSGDSQFPSSQIDASTVEYNNPSGSNTPGGEWAWLAAPPIVNPYQQGTYV